jgi:hypothetical protein
MQRPRAEPGALKRDRSEWFLWGRPMLSHSRSGAPEGGSSGSGATCRHPGTYSCRPRAPTRISIRRRRLAEVAAAFGLPLPTRAAVAGAALAGPFDLGRGPLEAGPTSSASSSVTDRLSPSGVSQLRWRSRPVTITRWPLGQGEGGPGLTNGGKRGGVPWVAGRSRPVQRRSSRLRMQRLIARPVGYWPPSLSSHRGAATPDTRSEVILCPVRHAQRGLPLQWPQGQEGGASLRFMAAAPSPMA